MPKLNQINAILMTRKAETEKAVTEIYKTFQRESVFAGREKTYQPYNEETGQKLPGESQRVQQRISDLLKQAAAKWADVWALVLTQDAGNQTAKADIVVDGQVLLADVPVTSLLYLDKQLNDLETALAKMPTPDPAEEWSYDANTNLLRSRTTETVRTNKEPVVIVKYEATDKHPAQTEIFTKDVGVGVWSQKLYSGCLPADQKEALLQRVRAVQEAVKIAREKANLLDVERRSAKPLLEYILGTGLVS